MICLNRKKYLQNKAKENNVLSNVFLVLCQKRQTLSVLCHPFRKQILLRLVRTYRIKVIWCHQFIHASLFSLMRILEKAIYWLCFIDSTLWRFIFLRTLSTFIHIMKSISQRCGRRLHWATSFFIFIINWCWLISICIMISWISAIMSLEFFEFGIETI